MTNQVSDFDYRCPDDLTVTATPLKRVMVVGSCLVAGWPDALIATHPSCEIDMMIVNNVAVLPPEPPHPPSEYDFHLIQIPLRSVVPDWAHMRIRYDDQAAYQRLFDESRARLCQFLDGLMQWNRDHGIMTFVCNFLVPQQNPMGRLQPRYDLRNMVYFVEKLNEALDEELKRYRNAYFFDFNAVVSTYGSRRFKDDVLWNSSHASALGDSDWELDRDRLDPVEPVSHYYPLQIHDYVKHGWRELLAMYRTARQLDMVKLVLVDLDDTVWRGVLAEESNIDPISREGWPFGFLETLLILKRRGVLLGIVSKNDEGRAKEIMRQMHNSDLTFEDFAVRRINWRPKADNIEEILKEVNLLPHSVVFVDDNPVERAAVKSAFPDMRVIGENPYLWRRILLWSPETQLPVITAESAARTEMVQAQVEREQQRKRLSREEFLESLAITVTLSEVASISDPNFPRTLELINKTNQFNTTGERRTVQGCTDLLARGGRFWTMHVRDRYTSYGLVGVLVTEGNSITQFVMSCRVIGLDVETAAVSELLRRMRADLSDHVTAALIETPANLLCRTLWSGMGFAEVDGTWTRSLLADLPRHPPHVTLETRNATLEPAI
jgi:FkbH-like protein